MLKYQSEEQKDKMQQLTKNISCQMHNNAHLLKNLRYSLPSVSIPHNPTSGPNNQNSSPFRNYATKSKQKLLRFPVLPLEETIPKLLKTMEPFLTPKEMEEHRKEAQVFLHCDGPKLQKYLEQAGKKEENWMSDRWLRYAYLKGRDSITYSSPGMTFPTVGFCDDVHFLQHISRVVYTILMFKQLVDSGKIPIQKMGKWELDNSQFGKVLGTNRIPLIGEDKMEYNPNSTHVVVIFKNHFYKLPVYTKTLKPLHPELIYNSLKEIYCAEKEEGVPYGILTTDNRDTWARAYKELVSIQGNKASVETIQKSLITVAIDGEVCYDPSDGVNNAASGLSIHGHGTKYYSSNRWFDKTIQLNVSRSGIYGFTYEHSPAEGQPIAMMVDFIVKNMYDPKLLEEAGCDDHEPHSKLVLKSNPRLDAFIKASLTNYDKLIDNIHINILQFTGYGKGFIKKQKLSPDSYCQAAIQYAFYKLHKTLAATYESAHLRIYYNGRTEVIRSCSNESKAFIKCMYEPNPDDKRVEMLRKAVNAHRDYTMLALQGKGVDRHLFGLRCMAIERKISLPNFFNLKGVKMSSHWRLATSQVASKLDCFMSYVPSVPDGYGVCYNPREDDIILGVSSWRSCSETCSDRYSKALKEAFDEMSSVLCRGGEKPKNKL